MRFILLTKPSLLVRQQRFYLFVKSILEQLVMAEGVQSPRNSKQCISTRLQESAHSTPSGLPLSFDQAVVFKNS